MRLGGRLSAAIEILDDMEVRHRPAAEALRDWGLSHRFAGAGDRAAIGNIVYDALRRRLSAEWLVGEPGARAQAFGALILESGNTPRALDEALAGDRFAPPPLGEDVSVEIEARLAVPRPDAVRADCQDWCHEPLQAAFGDGWVDEAEALAARPPLDLRVNTLLADRDKVLAELESSGARPAALAPHGLRIAPIAGDGRHPNVQAEPAYQKGRFEIQDEGSQLAAWLAGARPGIQVLDYCAGGGGKTLALAASMENRGQIFAHDTDKARLAPIFDRLKRAGARNVQVMAAGGDLSALVGRMDLVLVDAPCTGSGTWRRRPDAKWRLSPRQLDARVAEQAAILDRAAGFVRPGGRLVYVTCSVFPAENAERIVALTAARPEFRPVDHALLWREAFPGHPGVARGGPRGLMLTPLATGTDGFFVAILERGA